MEKSARRMASTTSDTGDTSSKQQQAQRKENYNKRKRPVCVCVRAHLCVRAHRVCVWGGGRRCVRTRTCVCVCVCARARAFVCAHMSARVSMRAHACVRIMRACAYVCDSFPSLCGIIGLYNHWHWNLVFSGHEKSLISTSACSSSPLGGSLKARLVQKSRSSCVSLLISKQDWKKGLGTKKKWDNNKSHLSE